MWTRSGTSIEVSLLQEAALSFHSSQGMKGPLFTAGKEVFNKIKKDRKKNLLNPFVPPF